MAYAPDFLQSEARCALAVFCRAPRLGTVKTRLGATHGDEFALGLYRAMLADTLNLARALAPAVEVFACFTPYDTFSDSSGQKSLSSLWDGPTLAQSEGDLGVKMLDCFAQLRSKGYQNIVLIGSDSPDMPLQRLQQAFEILKTAPTLAFGPAPDGGFYLIGASFQVPDWLFENVEWSSSRTLEAIRSNYATRQSTLAWAQLPDWRDVDDEADLLDLKRRLQELGTHAPHTREFLSGRP